MSEPCFNGATSFQTWKWDEILAEKRTLQELQWGHVFSDVEMAGAPVGPQLPGARLQWGHVFSDVEMTLLERPDTNSEGKLQWGHVFSDVEMYHWWTLDVEGVALQWGHVFSDVEM